MIEYLRVDNGRTLEFGNDFARSNIDSSTNQVTRFSKLWGQRNTST